MEISYELEMWFPAEFHFANAHVIVTDIEFLFFCNMLACVCLC